MPIVPLPVMLEDEEDRKIYENLEPPKTVVVRYGYMKMIAELPYGGTEKPGCGSKLVIRSPRGIELATMLTSTCPNAGCGHAVSRKEMLSYIDNSGGKNYPFTTQGKVLRIATIEDMNEQARLDARKRDILKTTNQMIQELDLPMKLVDVELLLGGERITFHYTSDEWVDFRTLVRQLASEFQTRIEMHQVNARDEARLVADYERCGQHCCCKQFLKVLKPVSMRSAKIQKATLDPAKISGRCGRLMCCLRYEDETYNSLRKKLPHRKSRVLTEEGIGTVIDTQILTQLALVRLDATGVQAAYPVENLEVLSRDRENEILDEMEKASQARAAALEQERQDRRQQTREEEKQRRANRRDNQSGNGSDDNSSASPRKDGPTAGGGETQEDQNKSKGKRRRRRGRNRGRGNKQGDGNQQASGENSGNASEGQSSSDGGSKKKRRRRRRRPGKGGGSQGSSGGDSPND